MTEEHDKKMKKKNIKNKTRELRRKVSRSKKQNKAFERQETQ